MALDMGAGRRSREVSTIEDLDVAFDKSSDLSSSRSFSTWYTNTTGKLMLVWGRIRVSEDIGSTNSSKQGAVDIAQYVNDTQSSRFVWQNRGDEIKLYTDGSGTTVFSYWQIGPLWVPDQWEYQVDLITNEFASSTILDWFEEGV